jgi:hypothetical protein
VAFGLRGGGYAGSVGWTLLPHGEPSWVLSKLAYLTLCRSIRLLAQLARGDAAKDLSGGQKFCM